MLTTPEPPVAPPALPVYRCPKCGHILFKGLLMAGSVVELKCHCNAFTTIAIPTEDARVERRQ